MALFFSSRPDFINRHSFNRPNRLCKTQPEQGEDIKSISGQKRRQSLNRHLTELFTIIDNAGLLIFWTGSKQGLK